MMAYCKARLRSCRVVVDVSGLVILVIEFISRCCKSEAFLVVGITLGLLSSSLLLLDVVGGGWMSPYILFRSFSGMCLLRTV